MTVDEVLAHLAANGHPNGGKGNLPGTPDDAFACWEYGGSEGEHVKGQAAPTIEKPRIQVIVRSKFYDTARLKAERIYRLLNGFSGSLGGVAYFDIRALQPPYYLDRDDLNRVRFVWNMKVKKELSPLV